MIPRVLKHTFPILVLLCYAVTGMNSTGLASQNLDLPGLPPEKVADYLHSIIKADRKIYTTYVVKRMQEKGIVSATEDWESKNAIPLPAQFLHYSSKLVAESGEGIRFRLISLWPIHRRNGPATEFERKGLEHLQASPEIPQRNIVTSGKKKFFQSIYADTAITTACISCHNTHPLSPKRDFKPGDLMGGIVITIPLQP